MCGVQSDHVRTHLYEIFVLPDGQISANILFNRILDGKHLSISLERHHLETERTDKKEVEKRFIIVAVANDVARLVFFGGAWVFRKRRASLFFFFFGKSFVTCEGCAKKRQRAMLNQKLFGVCVCVCMKKKGEKRRALPIPFSLPGPLALLMIFKCNRLKVCRLRRFCR